jgi:hypothetical protein
MINVPVADPLMRTRTAFGMLPARSAEASRSAFL